MRIALGIEYQGKNYSGFQRQKHAPTVQGCLEAALSKIADSEINLFCAGRTDAGVSATNQVIHFDTQAIRDERAWLLGTNIYLPDDIAVTWVKFVDDNFHARFSAKARRYRYIVQNTIYKSGLMKCGVSLYHKTYNVDAMHDAAQILLGENDFSAFKAADDESLCFYRNMHFINIYRTGPYIIFDIQANAFLHHMVRNIVGSLLTIGEGTNNKEWLKFVFESKDRTIAGPTAYANGLYLVDVIYDEKWNIPKRDFLGPLWLS